jgi:beta-lactamase regulating signal transducer with metallopeptidase domain
VIDIHTLDLVAQAIGSALAHSLWQGALIGGVTAVLLRVLSGATANTRYLLACLGLAAMAASWAATAAHTGRVLGPTLAARAANPPAVSAVELGPAGPLDFSPAIRILPPEALERTPEVNWTQRLEAWSVAAVPLWLAGVLVLSTRLGVGWLMVARLRRGAIAPVSDALARQTAALADRMRMRRAIRVMQSAAVQVPTVVGWLRPMVLLPVSVLTGLTPDQIASILAHELAHVRRHDYLVNVLQSAAEVLLFYHPACWWLSRRIRVEREHCCDDAAIAVCGDRLAYATALADLESLRSELSLALAVTDGPLLRRVRRLIAGGGHGPQSPAWVVAAGPVAVIVLVLVSAQMTSRAATVAELDQTSVPTAARVIPANEGVAEGRVVEFNSARPVAGATVLLAGPETSNEVTTNVEGRFEASRLKPGSYRLSARATGYVEARYGQAGSMTMDLGTVVVIRGGVVTRGLDMRLQRAGSVSGRVTDAEGKGLAGIEIELMTDMPLAGGSRAGAIAFAQTTEDGTYRMGNVQPGDYVVRAYASREAPSASAGPALTYASTFYPGVPTVEEAQRLRLDAGLDLLDIDFPLGTTRRFRVSGTLIDPTGEPLGDTWVMLHRMGASGGPGAEQKSSVDKEGHFEIRDVVPDAYMVNVFDRRTTSRWVAATLHLTVDADITDLELRASLGAQIEGRVIRDASATRALDSAQVRVGFEKAIPGPWGTMTFGGYRVVEDGRFSVESPGGPVQFRVMEVPPGWMVKSISVDGTEIDDGPIDLGSGRRQIEVVLTDKVSGVSGVVVDRNGSTLPNYSVVVFPADRSRWYTSSSRFVQSARSNNAGQFRIEVLPPGEYLAVAVAALPMNAWQNPAVLERLERGAERMRVTEGQRLTISIRASPTPEGLGAGVRAPLFLMGIQRVQNHADRSRSSRDRTANRTVSAGV